ncbi:MAG: hypothetical protein L6R40_000537 [Gallowayella cf. fulva]|nr:MAG: hypothetical protein L6R40_000537 [Xanthomendoza cf. fulva]
MADQSKTPFSFGNPTSGGLFGQQNSSSQPQGGLFGTSNKPTTTSTSSLFGGTSTAGSGPSIFGSANPTPGQSSGLFGGGNGGSGGSSNTFGGGNSKPTPTFSFGPNSAGQSSGGGSSLFGQAQSTPNQQPGASAPFSGFATPSKPADSASAASGQTSNLFGGGGSNLFQNPASSVPSTAATPTSKPAFSFPLGSTTPAGPPPSTQASTSTPFDQNSSNYQPEKKSLFPSLGAGTSSSQAGPSTSATPSSQNATTPGTGFFAGLGKPQGISSTQPSASSGGGGLFGNIGGQSSAGQKPQAAPTSLFGNQAHSSAAEIQKPSFSLPSTSSSQTPNQDAQKAQNNASSLFNLSGQTKSSNSSAPTSAAPSTSVFANFGKQGDTATSTGSSTSLFANVGKPGETVSPNTTSSGAAAPSLFSNLGRTQDTTSNPAGAANTTSQAQTQTPAPTSNLFGGKLGQSAISSAPSQPGPAATASTSGAPSSANATAGSTLGASTNGPAPSTQSRLKNKSMDEIITRWASDLAKYQKEFQKQAEKVASWDRMLVDNSEKIQKLYGSTLEAERATAEVERQITAVENDQNELESWLDRYEKEVDQMIANQSDSFHGSDNERERTYALAEKLSARLDEMGKDLGSMIEEINDASSSLNQNTKSNDPLSQVVRVLNSHLTQLQQIDQGANALRLKVAAAQQASQSLGPTNGFNGPSSDAADSFYRSFMGKR